MCEVFYDTVGGKLEIEDRNIFETLKREYLEELNVELKEIYYLGYLLVEENGEKYAQIRMIAKIKNIGDSKPDSDNGKVYGRFMARQESVKKYLNYQDLAGNEMIDDAIKIANQKYTFDFDNEEYYV